MLTSRTLLAASIVDVLQRDERVVVGIQRDEALKHASGEAIQSSSPERRRRSHGQMRRLR